MILHPLIESFGWKSDSLTIIEDFNLEISDGFWFDDENYVIPNHPLRFNSLIGINRWFWVRYKS